ncbi:MAG: hypothetical protein HMLKMBBP_02738 [Planctomycetes bacterium]|nr:hypothetical protein [Planctomycetota bacterium]
MIRQIRGRERGMSFWPFVITLLLFLVTVYLWYEASSKHEQQVSEIATLRDKLKAADEAKTDYNNRILALETATGFQDAAVGQATADSVKKGLLAWCEKNRANFTVEFDTDRWSPTGSGGKVEKLAGTKVKYLYLPSTPELERLSIETLLPVVDNAITNILKDLKQAGEAAGKWKKDFDAAQAGIKAALDAKDAARAELSTQKSQIETQFANREKELLDQIAAQKAAAQQANAEAETAKKEKESFEAKATSQINQLKSELKTAMSKDKPMLSEGFDGDVLDAGSGIAFINIGKKSMLMPGTVFDVHGSVKGGGTTPVGRIRVMSCDEGTAQCIVMDESPSRPIAQGDKVISPLFSANRKLTFATVGDFAMGRSQLEGKIKDLGGAVSAAISPTVDYLIVGSPASGEAIEDTASYKAAKEYGITLLTERDVKAFMNL